MHGLFHSDKSGRKYNRNGDRAFFRKAPERISAKDPYFDTDYDPISASATNSKPEPKKKGKFRVPTGNEQYRFLEKAVKKDAEEELEFGHEWRIARRMKPLGFSQRYRLRALNPWAGATWAQLIEQSLDELQARDGAYFATVFCEDWDFETDQDWRTPDDLVERFNKSQRTVRNRLRGLDYFLQLDVGLHRNARSYGRRVCVHFHGIVWGSRAKVRRAMKRFGHGYSGAKGGLAKPIRTWPRTMRYVAKDTRAAYVSFRRNVWGTDNRPPRLFGFREPMTRHNRRFLIKLFGSLTKPELCLGSGKGVEVLHHARQLAEANGWVRSQRQPST
jgi:hypothetical protein